MQCFSWICNIFAVGSFYLGMERIGFASRSSDFFWLDGTNVGDAYNNFANGEPDNGLGQEICGVFFTNIGLWRSERCETHYYVCQRPAGYVFELKEF